MEKQLARPVRFDPLDPAFLDDPYPLYERLREAGPISRGGPAQWVVPGHAEVTTLLREPRLSHEFPELYQRLALGDGPASDFVQRIVLYREGPSHVLLRRLMRRVLGATPAESVRARLGELVDGLLAAPLEKGHLDVMADLAFPLPIRVACELLGIPEADRDQVTAWGTEVTKAFTVILPEPERPAVDEATAQLRVYIADLLGGPSRPWQLEALAAGGDGDGGERPLAGLDLVDNVIFLFLGGFTTTVHLIGTGGVALLDHQEQLARLRADRSLLPSAVEEFLRWDAPIQHVGRVATEAFEFAGRTIRAGRIVHLLLGSANHDRRQFVDPDRLDVGRQPNPHLSFGGGVHTCLGATLGRLEATVAFGRIVDRFAAFEPDGRAVRRPTQVFRCYETIPAAVRAA
jgi:cytochrome P450